MNHTNKDSLNILGSEYCRDGLLLVIRVYYQLPAQENSLIMLSVCSPNFGTAPVGRQS